jgi:WD40 repeat protein
LAPWRSFRSSVWLSLLTLLVPALCVTARDTVPPQIQLRTYALHNNPHSADISPSGQLVITVNTVEKEPDDSGTRQIAEIAQIWNFKEDRLIAESLLQEVEVKASASGSIRNPGHGEGIVRFSPDGNLVVAEIDQTIYVLHATDLAQLRSFALNPPRDTRRVVQGLDKPVIRAMEVSPRGDTVAVLWNSGFVSGRVDLYNLASGKNVQSWETPGAWINYTKGLTWHPNGKTLLLAIPNSIPCMSPGSNPDVFAFDVLTGAVKPEFTTGLLTGSVAVTSDGRVLAVDLNCLGVFTNHDPKLKVFDLATGKKLREVSGRGAGVRYLVSASADGRRFLAFTGKMKAKFDWGDLLPVDTVVDETFSVWDLKTFDGIATSQNIPGLKNSWLRISSNGAYAVSYGKASFVYELP